MKYPLFFFTLLFAMQGYAQSEDPACENKNNCRQLLGGGVSDSITEHLSLNKRIERTVFGIVADILDGNTVAVQTSTRGRMILRVNGIDSPKNDQPYAKKAIEKLTEICHKKDIFVRYFTESGRVTIERMYCNEEEVAPVMVSEGLAWVDTPHNEKDELLLQLEKTARTEKIGLWRDKDALPPWEWETKKYQFFENRKKEQEFRTLQNLRGSQ